MLIYEYSGGVLQDLTRLQYQCADMTFYEKSRYNRLFHKVVHKGGESEIKYTKRFQNEKRLWQYQREIITLSIR